MRKSSPSNGLPLFGTVSTHFTCIKKGCEETAEDNTLYCVAHNLLHDLERREKRLAEELHGRAYDRLQWMTLGAAFGFIVSFYLLSLIGS